MPRRVSLPGANELFRPTVGSNEPQSVEVSQQSKAHRARKTSQDATSCGNMLVAGECAMMAMALADFEENGEDSALAHLLATD